jgi:hypothetical protein
MTQLLVKDGGTRDSSDMHNNNGRRDTNNLQIMTTAAKTWWIANDSSRFWKRWGEKMRERREKQRAREREIVKHKDSRKSTFLGNRNYWRTNKCYVMLHAFYGYWTFFILFLGKVLSDLLCIVLINWGCIILLIQSSIWVIK